MKASLDTPCHLFYCFCAWLYQNPQWSSEAIKIVDFFRTVVKKSEDLLRPQTGFTTLLFIATFAKTLTHPEIQKGVNQARSMVACIRLQFQTFLEINLPGNWSSHFDWRFTWFLLFSQPSTLYTSKTAYFVHVVGFHAMIRQDNFQLNALYGLSHVGKFHTHKTKKNHQRSKEIICKSIQIKLFSFSYRMKMPDQSMLN